MLLVCSFVNWCDLKPGDQATWIGAAVTFLYFLVTIRIWIVAKKTLKHAIEAQGESTKLFALLNTAWIDVTGVGYYRKTEQDYRRWLSVSYMNFGNVPATIISSKVEFRVGGDLIKQTEENPIESPLIPKHEKTTVPLSLENEELRKLWETQATLTLDIEIVYKGVGEVLTAYSRHTTFDATKDQFIDNPKPKANDQRV